MRNRVGTTILEVLFATGIVIVGLIGIASILPVAIRNSTQSNTSAEGLSLGLAWADSFLVRGLHQPRPANSDPAFRWVWYRDYGGRNVSLGWENALHDFPFSGSTDPAVSACWERVWKPSPLARRTPSRSSNATSITKVDRIWGRLPVCIDPYFMTSTTTVGRMTSANGGNTQAIRPGGYRAAVFPYYDDGFNPLVNPLSISQPTTPIDQPRMLRVSLAFGQQAPTSLPPAGPPPSGHLASRQLIQNLFSSVDDLAGDTYQEADAVDRTSPIAKRLFRTIPDAGGNELPLRSLTQGNYTWLATVVPEEPLPSQINTAATTAADNALVSLVVLNRHSHEFLPVDFNGQPLANNEIEENLDGERLTWVIPLSGNFVGGAGGRVRLVASDAVKSNVSVGDWIMLGRYFARMPNTPNPTTSPPTPPIMFPFFRWYRIIGVDAEASVDTVGRLFPNRSDNQMIFANASTAANIVWYRDVVLEGPDFAFAETVDPSQRDRLPEWHPSSTAKAPPIPAVPSPTIGTLVSGVVMVVERQVKLK